MERQEYVYGEAQTNDREWHEGELLSLVMDECHKTCKYLVSDMANGVNVVWYDNSLLDVSVLYHEVCGKTGKMVNLYDTSGGVEEFTDAIKATIREIVDNNKYKGI